jgi:Peptidase family M28/Peptidase family M1 domain/PDZ domain
MTRKSLVLIVILTILLGFSLPNVAASTYVHHDLKVKVEPIKQFIRVTNRVTLSQSMLDALEKGEIHFLLHCNLSIISTSDHIELQKETAELKSEFFGINTATFEIKKKIPVQHYSFKWVAGKKNKLETITFVYEGKIHHPIKQVGQEYARGFSETPGIISEEGAYLAGATFWVPWFNNDLVTFQMETSVPKLYDTVSQGRRLTHFKKDGKQVTVWDSPEPMDEVYLIAAKFNEYDLKVGKVNIMAFLRSDDQGLANKYLETTGQYLEMYEKLIGAYPYSKFALIENFWETGYGMPSFTLLGAKIIRFPFILHSSYPHELLHNWWGNSVFVDYESGNWCEGLTVFMADHLIKQQRSQGAQYRKNTLQGYTHYAADKKEEFPLTQFRARYNALSSSLGYGKVMMMFQMLRTQVGEKILTRAIQHFYKENKFKRATFDDIRKSFETISGQDLTQFFKQWVTRTGAPELKLKSAKVTPKGNEYVIKFILEQVQKKKPYILKVPVAVSFLDQKEAVVKIVDMEMKSQSYEFTFQHQPVAVDVDPQFDIFRKLHTNEIPATFSNAFGASQALILLPSKGSQEFLKSYRSLAENWAKESKGKIQVKLDSQCKTLPSDKAVWLLGWNNSFKATVEAGVKELPASFEDSGITILKKKLSSADKSIIVAVKNPKNDRQVVVLLSSDRPAALPGLARKLPHYGKYSYLAFEGDEPSNMYKGQWPAVNSPLSTEFTTADATIVRGKLPVQAPLGRLKPLFSSKRLKAHVNTLASKELEGRGLGSKGLEKAAHYIANNFNTSGLKPGGDNNNFFQTWTARVGKEKKTVTMRNVIGIIPGKNPALKDQAVILSAHYDHLGLGWPDVHKGDKGKIHFGADDNASGVAVMLELAHIMGKSFIPERTILFIAFTAEESGLLGSAYFVKQLKKRNFSPLKTPIKTIHSIVNMDTVGRLTEGQKLMVLGGNSAKEWKFIFMGIGYTVGIESQMVTQQVEASDQVSFIKAGIPGIQLFSGPHKDYHRPSDTADKIFAPGLVKVASVAQEAIYYLAGRKTPLTFQGSESSGSKTKSASAGQKTGRKVRTGIMPDFGFSGKGLKIGMVSPDSPAHLAGLTKGDVVIKLGDMVVNDLKEYANRLKTYKPGDTTSMTYIRDGKQYEVSITLSAR